MTNWTQSFDAYARHARLFPALLTILPGVVLAFAVIPSLTTAGVGAAVVTAAFSFGVVYLLSDIARAAGGRIEKKLLKKWGGWPTTIMLRHASNDLPAGTKSRYRAALAGHVPGSQFPTADEEGSDLAAADDQYASAVHWLKEQCRGPEYPLVLKENATYGFRRNLLALRPLGLTVTVIAALVAAEAAFPGLRQNPLALLDQSIDFQRVPWPIWASIGVDFLALLCWIGLVGEAYVREAADAYARTLLSCCDRL